jgi:hypothetical protein
MKTIVLLFLTFLCLSIIGPKAQAVSPPPDGGYPGANTAEGQSALFSLTTGTYNTAVGILSLKSNLTGSYNTAIGAGALAANNGDENTATGFGALLSNTTGHFNTANGGLSLFSNTTGIFNTAIGDHALEVNTIGIENAAEGARVLSSNTTGNLNTGVGYAALLSNTTGSSNTGIGTGALSSNTTGNSNIALGPDAGSGITTANNVIAIGVAGNDINNSCFIGNIFGATSSNGVGVLVNSNGRLGTMTSSRRFKKDIKAMGKASDMILALKPVTFRYKKEVDPDGARQFGLVAEDVEQVNPDLVALDAEGKPYSVRYDAVNAMLLNEFLKEHRKVERMEKQIEALTAGLQKVSAQLEVSKSAPQAVLNTQ